MRVLRSVSELRAYSRSERAAGRRTALVPTMGALHRGHLSLVAAGQARAESVIVSIFLNPTQFAPGEDLASYPCDLEGDLAKCREAGVAAVFAPTPDAMYPDGAQTWVEPGALAEPLCGASRPHFFRGVATVVTKLFIAAEPDTVVFGQKDYQQLQVVRRLVRDLLLDIEVVGAPIVREDDGLAMSSRNVHLDPTMRQQAQVLSRALTWAEAAVVGERSKAALLEGVRKEIENAQRAEIDYIELRDAETLEDAPERLCAPTLLALAVRFPVPAQGDDARVRLIDNRVLLQED